MADWSSGSDYFDYTRSGSLGGQGNGSIDKATKLAAGDYGGLVTYAGDPDFYQLNTVYSDTLDVTVNGTGLTVQEYDAEGLLVQTAEYADGKYTITVANGNYLRVEETPLLPRIRIRSIPTVCTSAMFRARISRLVERESSCRRNRSSQMNSIIIRLPLPSTWKTA